MLTGCCSWTAHWGLKEDTVTALSSPGEHPKWSSQIVCRAGGIRIDQDLRGWVPPCLGSSRLPMQSVTRKRKLASSPFTNGGFCFLPKVRQLRALVQWPGKAHIFGIILTFSSCLSPAGLYKAAAAPGSMSTFKRRLGKVGWHPLFLSQFLETQKHPCHYRYWISTLVLLARTVASVPSSLAARSLDNCYSAHSQAH